MKKINSKGFALVETLIVTSFVVGIFAIMYSNFYPIMGEYEKREQYNSVSSIYDANLFKRLIERNKNTESLSPKINMVYKRTGYVELSETDFPPEEQPYFSAIKNSLDIEAIYLLPYNISGFKSSYGNDSDFDIYTKDFINYLPNYINDTNNLGCRIIIKAKSDSNKESLKNNEDYKFGTIGVNCK